MDKELANRILKKQAEKSGTGITPELRGCMVDAMIEYARRVAYNMFRKALDEEHQINKEEARQRYIKAVKKLQIMLDGTSEVFHKYVFEALQIAAGLEEDDSRSTAL